MGERFQERPVIFDDRPLSVFLEDMIAWLRVSDTSFSVRNSLQELQGLSPALVTQLVKGRRRLTRDKVPALSRLLRLSKAEERFLDERVLQPVIARGAGPQVIKKTAKRAKPQNHLLKDWVNVYVLNVADLQGFTPDAREIHRLIGGIAPVARIDRSLKFLIREGYLRYDIDQRLVRNDQITVTTSGVPDRSIREAHKKSLDIARAGIDLFPTSRRASSAMILTLSRRSAAELKQLLSDFYEQLVEFAERHPSEREGLYQVVLHMTPIGGNHEN